MTTRRILVAFSNLVFAIVALSCVYLMPASWRAFHGEADDAAPAILRALEGRSLHVAAFDLDRRRIVTEWIAFESGVVRKRERYVVSWERDSTEKALTIYVRHEAQEQDVQVEGVPKWGATQHDSDRENAILDLIGRELTSGDVQPEN